MLVYRFAPSHFLLVVNGSNVDKDYAWIAEHAQEAGDAAVVNSSDRYALIAVQGPKALQHRAEPDRRSISAPSSTTGSRTARSPAFARTVSRTGYTGEDGFEIFVPPAMAPRVWDALLEAGKGDGLIPCGLGARDTLRLEAAMRLYGNDIDDTTTVLEADLGLDRRLEEGRRSSARRAASRRRRAASRARSSASRWSIAPSRGTAIW